MTKSINQNWFVSANLQVVTDSSSRPTRGKITKYDVQPFAQTTTTGNVAANGDTNFTVSATRKVHIESVFTSGSGKTTSVVWSQDLSYTNTQNYFDNNLARVRDMVSAQLDRLTHEILQASSPIGDRILCIHT